MTESVNEMERNRTEQNSEELTLFYSMRCDLHEMMVSLANITHGTADFYLKHLYAMRKMKCGKSKGT